MILIIFNQISFKAGNTYINFLIPYDISSGFLNTLAFRKRKVFRNILAKFLDFSKQLMEFKTYFQLN